ncbi:MAG: hypothetical protein ABJF04_01990 [Reichenbachiella sp.]|uniref:hypothetical protein n=1 Tax=Reichenbachiella sp. TaxID=2184521 RepID=UPI0032666A0B
MSREYAFTPKKDSDYHEELIEQAEIFSERVEMLSEASSWKDFSLNKASKELIRSFCHENIMNIVWYKAKIENEQFYRNLYNFITIILIFLIPFAIWGTTEFVNAREWKTGEKITSIVTVVLTFIFAIHKWLTAWMEKRNFISSFNHAKVELSNILFRIENDFRGFALDESGEFLTPQFKLALEKGIEDSKKVLQEDTKNYFEKLANPAFDLSGALISSATSAKQLFSQVKAESFKVEEWRKEAQDKEQREAIKKEERDTRIFDLRKLILIENTKYQALQDKILDLSDKEADLADKKESGQSLTQEEQKKLTHIQDSLVQYETNAGNLMIELAVKEAELELLLDSK